jgi:hypothetical protein
MRRHDFAGLLLLVGVFAGQGCFRSNESAPVPPLRDDDQDGSATAADSGRQGPDAIAVPAPDDLALDCPRGADSVVHVDFECFSVVVYTCKDLSNLVIEFEDGTRQRFEGQKGHTNAFSGTGTFVGKRILRVWVKAGANQSGDGPGYGERVETTVSGDCGGPRAGSGGSGCEAGPDAICIPQSTGGAGVGGRGAAGLNGPE